MNLLFFVPFLFPLAPWLAKRPRGAWRVCFGAVSVLVLLFPAIFSWGCDWSNCGQGAVAIFILAPVWLLFAVITPSVTRGLAFSTWAAARKLARTASDPPGPLPDRPPVGGAGVSAADLSRLQIVMARSPYHQGWERMRRLSGQCFRAPAVWPVPGVGTMTTEHRSDARSAARVGNGRITPHDPVLTPIIASALVSAAIPTTVAGVSVAAVLSFGCVSRPRS